MSGIEIVGLALGVAGIATDVAFSLSTFSRTVKNSSRSIKHLHREVSEVETVTHLISTTLGEERLAKAASEKLKDAIKSALESCKDVLKEINVAMSPSSNKNKEPPPAYAATEKKEPSAAKASLSGFLKRVKFTLMEEDIIKMRDSLRSSITMIGLLVQLLLSAAHIKEHPGQSLPAERLQGLAAYGETKEKPVEDKEKVKEKKKEMKKEGTKDLMKTAVKEMKQDAKQVVMQDTKMEGKKEPDAPLAGDDIWAKPPGKVATAATAIATTPAGITAAVSTALPPSPLPPPPPPPVVAMAAGGVSSKGPEKPPPIPNLNRALPTEEKTFYDAKKSQVYSFLPPPPPPPPPLSAFLASSLPPPPPPLQYQSPEPLSLLPSSVHRYESQLNSHSHLVTRLLTEISNPTYHTSHHLRSKMSANILSHHLDAWKTYVTKENYDSFVQYFDRLGFSEIADHWHDYAYTWGQGKEQVENKPFGWGGLSTGAGLFGSSTTAGTGAGLFSSAQPKPPPPPPNALYGAPQIQGSGFGSTAGVSATYIPPYSSRPQPQPPAPVQGQAPPQPKQYISYAPPRSQRAPSPVRQGAMPPAPLAWESLDLGTTAPKHPPSKGSQHAPARPAPPPPDTRTTTQPSKTKYSFSDYMARRGRGGNNEDGSLEETLKAVAESQARTKEKADRRANAQELKPQESVSWGAKVHVPEDYGDDTADEDSDDGLFELPLRRSFGTPSSGTRGPTLSLGIASDRSPGLDEQGLYDEADEDEEEEEEQQEEAGEEEEEEEEEHGEVELDMQKIRAMLFEYTTLTKDEVEGALAGADSAGVDADVVNGGAEENIGKTAQGNRGGL